MLIFRLILITIFVSLASYTAVVAYNHGLGLIPIFLSDIKKMAWPGQFNFDFLCFLILSASWVMWRNKFSKSGIVLGVCAFFGGALFLSLYLLALSFAKSQDIKEVLLGEQQNP